MRSTIKKMFLFLIIFVCSFTVCFAESTDTQSSQAVHVSTKYELLKAIILKEENIIVEGELGQKVNSNLEDKEALEEKVNKKGLVAYGMTSSLNILQLPELWKTLSNLSDDITIAFISWLAMHNDYKEIDIKKGDTSIQLRK